MRKEIESDDGFTIIQTTPALSEAVVCAAQMCGILAPYTNENNDALRGFAYPDTPSMAMPVTFAPWRDTANAVQLLAALDGTVNFDGVNVKVSVTREEAILFCEATAIVNTPAAKAKAMREALRAVMTQLVEQGIHAVVRL